VGSDLSIIPTVFISGAMVTGAGCITFRYSSCVAQEEAASAINEKMKYFFMAEVLMHSIVILNGKKP
jgi:hypothetical protein